MFGFMGDKSVRKRVLYDYTTLRKDVKAKLNGIARKLLKNTRLEFLVRDNELRAYREIWQAGEGLLFLYLADIKLRGGGKLCFVLPRSLLSGVSWFLARALLAYNYYIEDVIVSYEPNHYNFSESTSLSECMVIARKTVEQSGDDETRFVVLLKKPRTSMEAIALANSIHNRDGEYVEAGQAKAFIIVVKREELVENIDNWGRFVFLPNTKLLKEIESVLKGTLQFGGQKSTVPLIKLNEIMSSIGVDRHRFTDTFRMMEESLDTPQRVPGSVKMLKGGAEAQRRIMRAQPNAYALPLIDRGTEIFENIGGTLLVPNRIRVNTAHVTSMVCDEKVISNIFYVVRLKDERQDWLKAICVWLNTTWGILTILASREETHGAFISLNMSHWRLLPVLNVNALDQSIIEGLAGIFDKLKDVRLSRIPEQYGSRGRIDKGRVELDKSFLNIMGIQVQENDLLAIYGEIAQSLVQWIGD